MVVAEDAEQLAQPRQLIVSLYGLYARQRGGWLSVASVIRLMNDLGVDDQSTRSSISRLKRRGLLVPEKIENAAGYRLSRVAEEILADGDVRIFGRRRATVADGWLLVVFSVPETARDKRHQLRSQLTRLGFGTVAPGVWVAPGHLEAEATDVLRRLDVTEYAELFRGRHTAFGDPLDKVRQWWDLDALHDLYASFLARYRPVEMRWHNDSGDAVDKAFSDYVEMLTEWRQLPYADPGLPLELLPSDWNGLAAAELFNTLRELLAGPAGLHVRRVSQPPGSKITPRRS